MEKERMTGREARGIRGDENWAGKEGEDSEDVDGKGRRAGDGDGSEGEGKVE
jgi:hypothetical protein